MTTHTPGPWTVREPSRQRGEHCHIEANGVWVAEAIYNGTTAPAINANARLIATAPEMSALLVRVADYLAIESCAHDDDPMPGCLDCDVRALLARIDGGGA